MVLWSVVSGRPTLLMKIPRFRARAIDAAEVDGSEQSTVLQLYADSKQL